MTCFRFRGNDVFLLTRVVSRFRGNDVSTPGERNQGGAAAKMIASRCRAGGRAAHNFAGFIVIPAQAGIRQRKLESAGARGNPPAQAGIRQRKLEFVSASWNLPASAGIHQRKLESASASENPPIQPKRETHNRHLIKYFRSDRVFSPKNPDKQV